MLVCMGEMFMVSYVSYFEMLHAKQYRCGSDMFSIFDIRNQVMQNQNDERVQVCIVWMQSPIPIYCWELLSVLVPFRVL